MVFNAANRQSLQALFAGNAAHKWPKAFLQIGRNESASTFGAEDAMKQGVDVGVRQENLLFVSIVPTGRMWHLQPFPQRSIAGLLSNDPTGRNPRSSCHFFSSLFSSTGFPTFSARLWKKETVPVCSGQ